VGLEITISSQHIDGHQIKIYHAFDTCMKTKLFQRRVRNNYFLVVGDIAKQKSSIDESTPWAEFRLTYNRKLIHAIEINTHTHIKAYMTRIYAYMTRICKIMETTRCGTLY
jgi:hypothetical protein